MEARKEIFYTQIDTYIQWCEDEADMTNQTVETKRYNLERFAKQAKVENISDLTPKIFKEWKRGMITGSLSGQKLAPATCNTRIRNLKAFLKWAEEMREVQINIRQPMLQTVRFAQNIEDVTFYSREDIMRVCKSANKLEKLMIQLLFDSGMRISEFQSIRVGDINFSKGEIIILGKGRKLGRVYFSFNTGVDLQIYITKNRLLPSDYLWRSTVNNGLPYTKKTIRKKTKRAFARCGFKDFTPHQLRHSFATDLIERGATIQDAQHLLRHSSSKTTEIYIHNLQNKINDTYRKLHNEEIYYFSGLDFSGSKHKQNVL